MALSARALADTRHAFDGVAGDYARSNAENPLLRAMRMRVLAELTARVPAGSHVLDLGCGPGTDDETLARAGYRVTGVDWSPAMVAEATRRSRDARLDGRIAIRHLGIHEIDRLAPALFDAAYSNFGPLNCVPSLGQAARLIAARLRPDGVLVASVIGRVCPWEIALYLSRGDWRRATVRFARRAVPVPLNGRAVWTRYHAPGPFERVFAGAGFVRVSRRALGLFAPPPYLEAFAGRHPVLVDRLQRLDDRLGAWTPFRAWGDHFLVVMRKADS